MRYDLLREAASLGCATLHEAAGQIGALPSGIKPIDPSQRVCGTAFTVKSAPADNLWLHRALARARRGDVLVVDVGGHYEAGYWGDVMTTAAKARGVAGLVIDGSVRDLAQIVAAGFPVFARGLCIRGTGKNANAPGALESPIRIADVTISTGDLIVGDGDGVIAIPRKIAERVIERGKERESKEAQIMERLQSGETTLDIYGWK